MSGVAHQLGAPRQRATMRDVAALAGVGIKTVSRVMNREPSVHPDLVARVTTAAQKLGYRPNLAASNLRRTGGRTGTIGLLLEDVSNPFSAALHGAIEDVARQRKVLALTGSLEEDGQRERELALTLVDRRVDGLIVAPAARDQSYLVPEQRAGLHVVFIDRLPANLAADSVVSDNRDGARAAVLHLIARGHRRVAYLGDSPDIWTAQERFTGYRRALERAGLPVDLALVRHGLTTVEKTVEATLDLLDGDGPPTAFFTSQNLVTIGALRALAARDLQERVALVGFDDFPLADLLRPGVTTVAQDPVRIGTLAAEMLFRRIDGDTSPFQAAVVPTHVIARGSGEIPPFLRGPRRPPAAGGGTSGP